ncbi:MAG TPA: hypothetical protein VFF28_00650 [Candidatus Nanoarchaeia archaeon]|nr:hypothetical protein [Candidatus Nanoarchaeia archaeon]
MTDEGSYEIMPYKEIVELKKQISELQLRAGDTSSKELLLSMAALTKSVNELLKLFSSAAEEMKLEEKTEGELSQKIGPLIEKVSNLEQQNRTIAEGLVAVADMVKQIKGDKRMAPRQSMNEEDDEDTEREPAFFSKAKAQRRQSGPGFAPPPVPPMMGPGPMAPPPMQGMMPPPMPPGMGQLRSPAPDFGELPPLPPFEEEPRKKGLLGIFK